MKPTAGSGTSAGDIAAILGDFGFYQYDVQQFFHPVFRLKTLKNVCLLIVAQNIDKINLKNTNFSDFHRIHIKKQ